MARIRQAVLAARDLDPMVERLRRDFSLGGPFSEPGIVSIQVELGGEPVTITP